MQLDGYVRVSQVRGRGGDTFISPAVQRERIEQWAAAYGHRIAVVHEELDESGARADRPLLLEAIERVERGETGGVVVAKLDRFARSLVDGLRMIERIRAAGGVFVSVQDGLDLSTDTGRLVLRIMLSLAEFELDRVRGNWLDAKARAVMRGVHPCASPPFGYRRDGRRGKLLVDPVTGPLVRELFERRERGAGPTELAQWLRSTGAVTQRGRSTWSHRAVTDILRNDVYAGVASCGAVSNPDAHQPIIARALFDAVQWRGVQIAPRSAEPSPIRPLLRCAGCRYAMRAERRVLASGDVWYFTCRAKGQRAAWGCDAPAAVKDDGELQAWVVETFLQGLPDVAATRREESDRLVALEALVADRKRVFEEWRDDHQAQQLLGMSEYLAALAPRHDALNDALAQLADERVRLGAVQVPVDVTSLRGRWPSLSATAQRDLLQSGLRCVFVRGSSRTAPLPGRLHPVWWHGEPVELPSRGNRSWAAKPFVWEDERHLDGVAELA